MSGYHRISVKTSRDMKAQFFESNHRRHFVWSMRKIARMDTRAALKGWLLHHSVKIGDGPQLR